MNKIVLTGGGTAGHVYPAIAVKEELDKEFEFHYIGGKGMEKDIISKFDDIKYHQISTVKLERKFTFQNFKINQPIKKNFKRNKTKYNIFKRWIRCCASRNCST